MPRNAPLNTSIAAQIPYTESMIVIRVQPLFSATELTSSINSISSGFWNRTTIQAKSVTIRKDNNAQ